MEGRQQEGVACERKPLACTAVRDSELRAGLLSNVAKKLLSARTTRAFIVVARFPPFHPSREDEPFTRVSSSVPVWCVRVWCVSRRVRSRQLSLVEFTGVTVLDGALSTRLFRLSQSEPFPRGSCETRLVLSPNVKDDAVVCCSASTRHPLDLVADGRSLLEGGPAVGRYRECVRIATRQRENERDRAGIHLSSHGRQFRSENREARRLSWYRSITGGIDNAGACSRVRRVGGRRGG